MKPKKVAVIRSYGEVKKIKNSGADVIELRVDLLNKNIASDPRKIVRFIKRIKGSAGLPVITTIRLKNEGGKFSGSEKSRLAIFKKIIPYADYIDIELNSSIFDAVCGLAKNKKKIVSYHNFKMTPPGASIKHILERYKKTGLFRSPRQCILKIACMVKNKRDLSRLLAFTEKYAKKWRVSVIPMGKCGQPGRIIAPSLGSVLSYFSASKPVAPGQITLKNK
ncbi:MAG: type I 3-dehydroquinate dehydratase [Elusimicrobiota bacterium]